MRILFLARHFSSLRNYEQVITRLASRGHDVHLAAMADADRILEDAAFTHWEETDAASLPPEWGDVIDRLDEEPLTY